MQSSACTYIHAHMHCMHWGFACLSIHAEAFILLPNYSAVRKYLSDMSMCWIWEQEAGHKLRAASFKMSIKNITSSLLPPVCKGSHRKLTCDTSWGGNTVMLTLLRFSHVLWQNCLYMTVITPRLDLFIFNKESRSEKYHLWVSWTHLFLDLSYLQL